MRCGAGIIRACVPRCRRGSPVSARRSSREMTRLANEHGAINLAQGFPDFDGPEFVKEAAIAAIRAGHGQYARVPGIPELHRALCGQVPARLGPRVTRRDSEIVVTSGATEAIFAAIQGALRAGRRGRALRAVLRLVPGERRDGRRDPALRDAARAGLDASIPAELAAAFGERTRAHPPQHAAQSDRARSSRATSSRRSRGSAASATSSASPTRSTSTSCTRAGTSRWRRCPACASARSRSRRSARRSRSPAGRSAGRCAPPELAAAVRAAHQFITFATATPLQHGAAAALSAGPGVLRRAAARTIASKRDFLAAELSRLGFQVEPAAGDVLRLRGLPPLRLRRRPRLRRHLIENVGVAAIPPSVFYDNVEKASSYVRFAFCKRTETLERAVARLDSSLRERAGVRGNVRTMRIALVQMDIAWEDVGREPPPRSRAGSRRRPGDGARLALLPEMFCTGFSMDAERIAQPPGGPTETFLREAARDLGLWVLASIPEAGEPRRATWRSSPRPTGDVARYAKIHPFSFAGEDRVYTGRRPDRDRDASTASA